MIPEGEANGEPAGRRIEALLGYFYRDLKGELGTLRRENAEIRSLLETGGREVAWLRAVEVEPEGSGGTAGDDAGEAEAPERVADEEPTFRVGMPLENLERIAIERTLAEVNGNRSRAAKMLGIGERTLYRKLSQYRLS